MHRLVLSVTSYNIIIFTRIVITTKGTHPSSVVTHTFRKVNQVMKLSSDDFNLTTWINILLVSSNHLWKNDRNHKFWNIISTERYIHCTSYAGAAGMLLHINGKFTMGKLKSSLLS